MRATGVLVDALKRIVPVVLVIGVLAGGLGYWHTREVTRQVDVRVLRQEAQRALDEGDAGMPTSLRLEGTVQHMVRGTFAVAQAYGPTGHKVAEAAQPGFESLPTALSALSHVAPRNAGTVDSASVGGRKVERISSPVIAPDGRFLGHVEGIRVVGAEERATYRRAALESALIAMGAVLLCTITLAPLLTSLAQRNFRWARSLLDAHLGMLEAFGRAIARRDSDTGLHNYRVTWIAARIGEEIRLAPMELRNLIAGAFLHDIGKIGVPDEILLKPGPLDERERPLMQAHVEMGAYIVGSVGFLGARDVIASHHERWDGNGYPHGLAGHDIPRNARIFCIADVYDALRARRPYKDAYPFEQAMAIMRAGRGTHFDPELFDVFERIVAEVDAKVINADEERAIALMRSMINRHFMTYETPQEGEGWTGSVCCPGPGHDRAVATAPRRSALKDCGRVNG